MENIEDLRKNPIIFIDYAGEFNIEKIDKFEKYVESFLRDNKISCILSIRLQPYINLLNNEK